jgi:hypothetical protein
MEPKDANAIFTRETLDNILPPQLSDNFFEAMYGDAAEGAYDIRLTFIEYTPDRKTLEFEIQLHERPGKCLACNLTYGLPQVFSRHPLLNVNGIVEKIVALMGEDAKISGWELGRTQTPAASVHAIPLTIRLS